MQVKTETIIRTIVLALALANQLLAGFGKSPIPVSDIQVEQGVSLLFTVAASLWAWWKNNSVTEKALKADAYLEQLRNED